MKRARLADALENNLNDFKLILLSAPAGYGKTTALVQWAHISRFRVAWFSIEKEDNDLERFLRYLFEGWAQVQPEIRESPLGLLLEAMAPDIDAVLSSFINVASGTTGQVVFVLDDVHLIDDESIHCLFDGK